MEELVKETEALDLYRIGMIKEFQGRYRWLSNFWITPSAYNGVIYRSSEHAFQAAKSTDREYQARILNTESPALAKKLAREVKPRVDWNLIRDKVMLEVVRSKFNLNVDLKRELLDTYPRHLQEGNLWKDTYWGVDLNTSVGENKLGKILMQVREEIRTK
jgi:ribA/ribD-fused uncharacterized protein